MCAIMGENKLREIRTAVRETKEALSDTMQALAGRTKRLEGLKVSVMQLTSQAKALADRSSSDENYSGSCVMCGVGLIAGLLVVLGLIILLI